MKNIRVLIVEDSDDDAQLLVRVLKREGYEVAWERVQTADDMRTALQRSEWDIVISDYTMPSFSARQALATLHESGLDLPFIIVSGTVGEEIAIDALKAGAHDFLVKGRFARLAAIIERERREASARRGHRNAERALRVSETRYRTIVETAQEGIWTVDAEGRTTYLNQRMAQMVGCAVEDMRGRLLLDFVDPEWQESAAAVLRAPVEGTTDILFRRWDGSEFWGTFSASRIDDPESGGIGTLVMVVDTTQQRQLQAQLMMADRMVSVGMLAAGLAHEINNPLAAALIQLEVADKLVADKLMEQLRNDFDAQAIAGRAFGAIVEAREATIRVRDIVRDLRIFSRGDETQTGAVDIHAILDSTVRLAWNEIRHRARLTKDYHATALVRGSDSRLGQVFLNLVVNAAQAIPAGAAPANEIRIATRSISAEEVVIEISDTGCGMSQDALRRLFVPFYTTKPAGIGTGLGLSICHRIVTSLGGRISADSIVGRGSTLRVILPAMHEVAVEPPPAVESTARRTASSRTRVLIIDDDALVLSSLQAGLELEHDVRGTTSAHEALQRIQNGERFEVILCDVMMPSMTGEEFYNELDKIAPEQTPKIVFLTGGAFTPQTRAFMEAVPNVKLTKPASLDEIVDAIDSIDRASEPLPRQS